MRPIAKIVLLRQNGHIDRVDTLVLDAVVAWPGDPGHGQRLEPFNTTIETVCTYLPGPSAVLVSGLLVAFVAFVCRGRPPSPAPSGRSNLLTTTHQ